MSLKSGISNNACVRTTKKFHFGEALEVLFSYTAHRKKAVSETIIYLQWPIKANNDNYISVSSLT